MSNTLTILNKIPPVHKLIQDRYGRQSNDSTGAVKLMRTRIGLLAQPKSMRSIIDATQREQRHGSA